VAEKHMAGRKFVVGEEATIADFVLAYTLDWANEVQLLDRCPQLVAYMERMYARPKAPKRIAQLRAALGG
jgi:glutathione S-transferase